MKCKKHFSDVSSSVGVCATCLRERLSALIAAQENAHAHAQRRRFEAIQTTHEDRRRSDTNPPPLVFPRSVSPYVSRRKADTTPWQYQHSSLPNIPDQRFFSTPQVNATSSYKKKKSYLRFTMFSRLFRSRSEIPDSDPRVSNFGDSYAESSSSSSWFSTMLPGRRKKKSGITSIDESTTGGHTNTCHTRDRGMSPPRYSDDGGSSGYSSEESSSQGWKQTPMRTPAADIGRRCGGKSSHNRNLGGMAFCLSPLVRASPSRTWNQKGMPPEMVFSGDLRVPVKTHVSNVTSSFCKNRSRKLADFGRFNPNQ